MLLPASRGVAADLVEDVLELLGDGTVPHHRIARQVRRIGHLPHHLVPCLAWFLEALSEHSFCGNSVVVYGCEA